MLSQLLHLGDAFVLVPLQLPNLGAQHLLFVHVMEQVVKLLTGNELCEWLKLQSQLLLLPGDLMLSLPSPCSCLGRQAPSCSRLWFSCTADTPWASAGICLYVPASALSPHHGSLSWEPADKDLRVLVILLYPVVVPQEQVVQLLLLSQYFLGSLESFNVSSHILPFFKAKLLSGIQQQLSLWPPADSVTTSKLVLQAAWQANELEMRCWGKMLFGDLADQEDGRLMSQNNYLLLDTRFFYGSEMGRERETKYKSH